MCKSYSTPKHRTHTNHISYIPPSKPHLRQTSHITYMKQPCTTHAHTSYQTVTFQTHFRNIMPHHTHHQNNNSSQHPHISQDTDYVWWLQDTHLAGRKTVPDNITSNHTTTTQQTATPAHYHRQGITGQLAQAGGTDRYATGWLPALSAWKDQQCTWSRLGHPCRQTTPFNRIYSNRHALSPLPLSKWIQVIRVPGHCNHPGSDVEGEWAKTDSSLSQFDSQLDGSTWQVIIHTYEMRPSSTQPPPIIWTPTFP